MHQILKESEKSLDVMIIAGLSPIPDLLHFIHTHMDTRIRYDVTKAVHPLGIEVNFRALREYKYSHRYLQVDLWENLFLWITHVPVPGT